MRFAELFLCLIASGCFTTSAGGGGKTCGEGTVEAGDECVVGYPDNDGPVAYVDLNLPLDSQCSVDLSEDGSLHYIPSGLFDIAVGSGYCARDYDTHLRISSFLRPGASAGSGRADPNILMVHSVEVTLKAQDDRPLSFIEANPPLPNPFRLITGVTLLPSTEDGPAVASLTVKTIPAAYAEYLMVFTDQTIIADIEVFGTTVGDVDVEFEKFSYPIQICSGCLTGCASQFSEAAERQRQIGEVCDDDAGQDGRVCFDIAC